MLQIYPNIFTPQQLDPVRQRARRTVDDLRRRYRERRRAAPEPPPMLRKPEPAVELPPEYRNVTPAADAPEGPSLLGIPLVNQDPHDSARAQEELRLYRIFGREPQTPEGQELLQSDILGRAQTRSLLAPIAGVGAALQSAPMAGADEDSRTRARVRGQNLREFVNNRYGTTQEEFERLSFPERLSVYGATMPPVIAASAIHPLLGAATASSLGMGEVAGAIEEQGIPLEDRPGSILGGGGAIGALDAIVPMSLAGALRRVPGVPRLLAGVADEPITQMGTRALTRAGTEGATEAAQEQVPSLLTGQGFAPFGQTLEAGAAGTILGGGSSLAVDGTRGIIEGGRQSGMRRSLGELGVGLNARAGLLDVLRAPGAVAEQARQHGILGALTGGEQGGPVSIDPESGEAVYRIEDPRSGLGPFKGDITGPYDPETGSRGPAQSAFANLAMSVNVPSGDFLGHHPGGVIRSSHELVEALRKVHGDEMVFGFPDARTIRALAELGGIRQPDLEADIEAGGPQQLFELDVPTDRILRSASGEQVMFPRGAVQSRRQLTVDDLRQLGITDDPAAVRSLAVEDFMARNNVPTPTDESGEVRWAEFYAGGPYPVDAADIAREMENIEIGPDQRARLERLNEDRARRGEPPITEEQEKAFLAASNVRRNAGEQIRLDNLSADRLDRISAERAEAGQPPLQRSAAKHFAAGETPEAGLEAYRASLPEGARDVAPPIHRGAQEYLAQAGIEGEVYTPAPEPDQGFHDRMAEAYLRAPHAPRDPEVRRAYEAFNRETEAQYRQMTEGDGIRVVFVQEDPYTSSAEMMRDVLENKTLRVFKGGEPHELMTGMIDTPAGPESINNIFRAVHDYYGHAHGFAPFETLQGEEGAYRRHSTMYGPEARRAMAVETRGQTSTYYRSDGPREFPEQKATLLPEEFTGVTYPDESGEARFADVQVGDDGYARYTMELTPDDGEGVWQLEGEFRPETNTLHVEKLYRRGQITGPRTGQLGIGPQRAAIAQLQERFPQATRLFWTRGGTTGGRLGRRVEFDLSGDESGEARFRAAVKVNGQIVPGDFHFDAYENAVAQGALPQDQADFIMRGRRLTEPRTLRDNTNSPVVVEEGFVDEDGNFLTRAETRERTGSDVSGIVPGTLYRAEDKSDDPHGMIVQWVAQGGNPPTPEQIRRNRPIAAAVRGVDPHSGEIYRVAPLHAEAETQLPMTTPPKSMTDGFLLADGSFITRDEAIDRFGAGETYALNQGEQFGTEPSPAQTGADEDFLMHLAADPMNTPEEMERLDRQLPAEVSTFGGAGPSLVDQARMAAMQGDVRGMADAAHAFFNSLPGEAVGPVAEVKVAAGRLRDALFELANLRDLRDAVDENGEAIFRAAAIRLPDGTIFEGPIHHLARMEAWDNDRSTEGAVDGFTLPDGTFVPRSRAHQYLPDDLADAVASELPLVPMSAEGMIQHGVIDDEGTAIFAAPDGPRGPGRQSFLDAYDPDREPAPVAQTIATNTLRDGGGTHDLEGQTPPAKQRYMVGSHSVSVPLDGNEPHAVDAYIRANEVDLRKPGFYVGTFHNPESGMLDLDVTRPVPSRKLAEALTVENEQESFYDAQRGRVVRLWPQGEPIPDAVRDEYDEVVFYDPTEEGAAERRVLLDNELEERAAEREEAFLRMAPPYVVEEYEAANEGVKKNMLDEFSRLRPQVSDIAEIARLGADAFGWYWRSAESISRMVPPGEVDGIDPLRFSYVTAVFSPNAPVPENQTSALHFWMAWTAMGRPTDETTVAQLADAASRYAGAVLPGYLYGPDGKVKVDQHGDPMRSAVLPNLLRVVNADPATMVSGMQNGFLSGLKVDAFGMNLVGDITRATMDTHMGRGMNVSDPSTKARNFAMQAVLRGAERELGGNWTMPNVQETTWQVYRAMKELARRGKISEVLFNEDGELDIPTYELLLEMIATPSDFAAVLARPENEEILHHLMEFEGWAPPPDPATLTQYDPGTARRENPPAAALRRTAERMDAFDVNRR